MANKELKTLNFGDDDVYYPLPIITSEDNNKILAVIDGEWGVLEVANAEEGAY
jgi:hypothetical protein